MVHTRGGATELRPHAIDRNYRTQSIAVTHASAPIVAPFVIVARWLSSERVIASGFSEASAKGYVGTATVTANVWDGFLEEALELQNLRFEAVPERGRACGRTQRAGKPTIARLPAVPYGSIFRSNHPK